jgi:hypothetical protein
MDVEIGEVVSTVRAIDGDAALSPREEQRLVNVVLARVRDEQAHTARARAERQIDAGRGDMA